MFTIYSSDVTGNPGNCSYPHKQVILDEDSLKNAISHDYVCAEYKNSYRNGDNFIGSNCLPVDCDNDHSENPEDWIAPELSLIHISEPTRQAEISYAVFCLKKKKKTK